MGANKSESPMIELKIVMVTTKRIPAQFAQIPYLRSTLAKGFQSHRVIFMQYVVIASIKF